MPRRIYHKKRFNLSFLTWPLVILLVVWGGVFMYKKFEFSPQDLVDNSVLRGRSFAAKVQEAVSTEGKVSAYLLEDKTNPIISIDFIFKGAGTAADASDAQGLAKFTVAMLKNGTKNYSAQKFKERLEELAVRISFSVDNDDFSGRLVTPKENAAEAYALLQEVLSAPRFAPKDMQRTKAEFRFLRQKQREHPASELGLVFKEEVYNLHPYGRNPLGEEKAVEAFTAKDLRQMMQKRFAKSNLIVGIAGDITAAEASEALTAVFGALPEKAEVNFVREAEVNFDNRVRNVARDSKQIIALSAMAGVSRKDADFYPVYIANYIYGGAGLNSRLAQAVREKQGLVYSISSDLGLNDKSNVILSSFSTSPQNFAEVKALVAAEKQKFAQKGVKEAELQQAKDYLIASYNLRFASIDGISLMLALMQKDNLGIDFLQKRNDYIKEVSLEEVNRAAAKYFGGNEIAANIGNFK